MSWEVQGSGAAQEEAADIPDTSFAAAGIRLLGVRLLYP